jgi:hypothetical protein
VVDDIRSDIGHEGGDGDGVKKVRPVCEINADHGVALAKEVSAKVFPHKSRFTGYKSPHGVTLGPSRACEFEQCDEFVG